MSFGNTSLILSPITTYCLEMSRIPFFNAPIIGSMPNPLITSCLSDLDIPLHVSSTLPFSSSTMYLFAPKLINLFATVSNFHVPMLHGNPDFLFFSNIIWFCSSKYLRASGLFFTLIPSVSQYIAMLFLCAL